MIFGRKKKKRTDSADKGGETMYDALISQKRALESDLMRLEESRKNGEISEEEYLKLREKAESLIKEIDGMLGN